MESQVLSSRPSVLEKAALLLKGKQKLSRSGKQGGKRAVIILLAGGVVAYQTVAMSLKCFRSRSVGIKHTSNNRTSVLVE